MRASVLMGLGPDYGGKGSLTGYLLDLERRLAAGDDSAAMPAADLLRNCSLATGSTAVLDAAHPSKLVLDACRTLPAREPGNEHAIVATAAREDVRDAVLAEWGFAPPPVACSRDLDVRREWATGAAGRLQVLADKGDIEARLLLGRAYVATDFGMSDHAKAARQFGSLSSARCQWSAQGPARVNTGAGRR